MTKICDRWRRHVTETLTDWRLGCIQSRPTGAEIAVFHEGIKDLARLRLTIAYMPLLQALERIERRFGVLANLRAESWAAPSHPVNRRDKVRS